MGDEGDDAFACDCGGVLCYVNGSDTVSNACNCHPLGAGRSCNGHVAALENVRNLDGLLFYAQRIVSYGNIQIEVNSCLTYNNLAGNAILVFRTCGEGDDCDTLATGVVCSCRNGDEIVAGALILAESEPIAVYRSSPGTLCCNVQGELTGSCGECLVLGRNNQVCVTCRLEYLNLVNLSLTVSLSEDGDGSCTVSAGVVLFYSNLECAVAVAACRINFAPVSRRSNLPRTVASNAHKIFACILGEGNCVFAKYKLCTFRSLANQNRGG